MPDPRQELTPQDEIGQQLDEVAEEAEAFFNEVAMPPRQGLHANGRRGDEIDEEAEEEARRDHNDVPLPHNV